MTTAGYSIECTGFYANNKPNDPTLGSAYLLLTPPGLMLLDVLVIRLDCGVRIASPRRGVLNNGPARPGLNPIIRRAASFPDPDDWAAFSERALAAIDVAFPGMLLRAASCKVLSARKQSVASDVPAPATYNESANHAD
jgi:hypothetical protein